MNDEQIFELAEKIGFQDDFGRWNFTSEGLLDFVFMVQKAERERVANWMLERSYATGHGDTIEELLKELEWQATEKPWVKSYGGGKPNYITPPKQEWDGPTDEEYENFCSLIQREEAKLKEKNSG
jgi:hypothetical protein